MDHFDSWLQQATWNPETVVQDEMKCEKDISYLRNCYPKKAKEMVEVLCETCDQMEYENSSMLVPYPDKETIHLLVDRIYDSVKKKKENSIGRPTQGLFDNPQMSMEEMKEMMEKDILLIMLCDEMHRRRMRYCRRNQFFSTCENE